VKKFDLDALQTYLTAHFAEIEGWCWQYNYQPIQYLAQRQAKMGSLGPIAEIGVYRGKFFIGLALVKGKCAPHVAIDVFDMQQFSLAGDGSRIRVPKSVSEPQLDDFRANLRRCGIDPDSITILRADSTSLNGRDIEAAVPGFRKFSFFSVDGCHEFTHAYHDIAIAMELTENSGVIFVDDYLHARWPGAQEAVAKHMFGGAPRFVPLYYIYNKLALCHVNFHQDYLEGLQAFYRENHKDVTLRRITRYGWTSLTIEPKDGMPVLAPKQQPTTPEPDAPASS